MAAARAFRRPMCVGAAARYGWIARTIRPQQTGGGMSMVAISSIQVRPHKEQQHADGHARHGESACCGCPSFHPTPPQRCKYVSRGSHDHVPMSTAAHPYC
eukprot:365572-Chlamydomonas_euryale.AAC.10